MGSKPENTAEEFGKVVSQAFLVVFREVQTGELAMILFCGGVVGLCSLDFGVETTEPETLAAESDVGDPSAGVFFERDADIAGGSFGSEFRPIAGVLRVIGEAKVIDSVVKAVAVFMVYHLAFLCTEDLAMHIDEAIIATIGIQSYSLVGGGVVGVFLGEPGVIT